mmetsp:Transcript_79084/g.229688  ORF Transcript_79084/g.229688 Transcript_79084/m.229688 type:complete len:369 (+) Transcript_79084:62-1168(+)
MVARFNLGWLIAARLSSFASSASWAPCWERGFSKERCCGREGPVDPTDLTCFDAVFTREQCCSVREYARYYPEAEAEPPSWEEAFRWATGGYDEASVAGALPLGHPAAKLTQRRWEASMANVSEETHLATMNRRLRFKSFVRSAPYILHELEDDVYRFKQLRRPAPGQREYVVDIGANLGYTAILLAAIWGPDVRIIAIEPVPANFRYLTWNIRLNGLASRIWPLNLAVGGTSMAATPFFYHPTDPISSIAASKVHCSSFAHQACSATSQDQVRFDIPVVTLAEILASLGLGIVHFLKVDCEGCEWELFDPVTWSRLRHRISNVATELHPFALPGTRPEEEAALRDAIEAAVCKVRLPENDLLLCMSY